MTVENPVLEKPVGDAAKPSTNNAPRSFSEVTEQAKKHVHALKHSFNEQFHQVMRELDTLAVLSKGMNEAAVVMKQIRDKLFEIGISLGKPQDVAEQEKQEASMEDSADLMSNKFSQIREFIRTSADNLKTTATSTEERTDFETRSRIMNGLKAYAPGLYLLENFEDELHVLLDQPYSQAAHDAFKVKVLQKYQNDPSVPATDKIFGNMILSSLINSLRAVENLKGNSHLSAASIDGMLGHVPSEEEMNALFNGHFEYIQSLPAGSVRLTLVDRTIDFYHDEKKPIPADIVQIIEGGKLPITDVHYRTDADVAILLADMSKGEFLRGKMCNGGDCVEIEGQTKSPDVDLHQTPAGLDKKELLAHPMKYLSHNIVFSTTRMVVADEDDNDEGNEK